MDVNVNTTSVTPVEGFLSYIREWRDLVNASGRRLSEPRKESFLALLDAAETYANNVLSPAYQNDSAAKGVLDEYWSKRHAIFLQPMRQRSIMEMTWRDRLNYHCMNNMLSPKPKTLGVARMFVEDWLEHTRIGEYTPEYRAVMTARDHVVASAGGARQRAG